jgi:hypothetical protein
MPVAIINTSTAGLNQLVPGIPGKRFRVIAFILSFAGTVTATFQTGQLGTAIFGPLYGGPGLPIQSGPLSALYGQQRGQFTTNEGDDLSLNLSAAVGVGGGCHYDIVND